MDLVTLVFANFVLLAFATVAFAFFGRYAQRAAGLREFTWAAASLAASAGIIALADAIHHGPALAVGNGLLVWGFVCLNWGIARYGSQAWRHMGWHLSLVGATIGLYVIFTGSHNHLGARAVIVASASAIELGLGAWRFARLRAHPAALVMAGFALFNLARGPLTWEEMANPRRERWVLAGTDYGFLFFSAVLALALVWVIIADLRARLHRLALTDDLTGLANRRGLEQEVERLVFGRDADAPASVLVMDLDHFKQLNDRHGHPAGDEALRTVAALLRRSLRASDVAARLGGEEFVVLLPKLDLAAATRLAERLRQQMQELGLNTPGPLAGLTASWGVAARQSGEGWQEWLQRGDRALYAAKSAGRNCVRAIGAQEARAVATGN